MSSQVCYNINKSREERGWGTDTNTAGSHTQVKGKVQEILMKGCTR